MEVFPLVESEILKRLVDLGVNLVFRETFEAELRTVVEVLIDGQLLDKEVILRDEAYDTLELILLGVKVEPVNEDVTL